MLRWLLRGRDRLREYRNMIAAALHIWWLPAAVIVAWRIDVNLNPFRPCRRCGGSGKGRFSRERAHGLCMHGPERVPRVGARRAAARQRRRRGM